MTVLLDTHILLWMIGESRSLSDLAMRILADETYLLRAFGLSRGALLIGVCESAQARRFRK